MRRRRQQRSGPPVAPIVGGILAILLVVGGVWYWLQSGEPDHAVVTPTTAEADPGPTRPDVPPLDLPDLDASDEFVRGMVSRLSSHPQLARWLVTDDLVHRFVRVVVELAGQSHPAEHVEFMRPEEEFRVQEVDGRLLMHPESTRRYDLLTATFVSLDTEGTVELYWQLRPLIDEAYAELGFVDRSFDETLDLAIQNLLAVQVPDGQIEVVRGDAVVYEFADPRMESNRGAVKGLIRMGPENARRIQAKLEEFSGAFDGGPSPR